MLLMRSQSKLSGRFPAHWHTIRPRTLTRKISFASTLMPLIAALIGASRHLITSLTSPDTFLGGPNGLSLHHLLVYSRH